MSSSSRHPQRPHARRGPAPMGGMATGPTVHWVAVPRSVPFRNRGSFWAGDKLLQRQPNLAICQDRVRSCFVLLFCDRRWSIRGATTAASVAEAKSTAERYYPGLLQHWVSAGVTARQAERYMQRLRDEYGCSFCGRAPGEQNGSQFESKGARICSSCIRRFHATLPQNDRP
jgi:hypothetical protein